MKSGKIADLLDPSLRQSLSGRDRFNSFGSR
jgi:hypothetical protein